MNEQELNEIEERAAKATPGPWRIQRTGYTKNGRTDGISLYTTRTETQTLTNVIDMEDAFFIAYARQDVPALAAEVRRMRAALEKIAVAQIDGDYALVVYQAEYLIGVAAQALTEGDK